MSYCRFGEYSDVYLYPSVYGGIVCCSCRLSERPYDDITFETQEQALIHLEHHDKSGHEFPLYAILSLEAEIKEDIRHPIKGDIK